MKRSLLSIGCDGFKHHVIGDDLSAKLKREITFLLCHSKISKLKTTMDI